MMMIEAWLELRIKEASIQNQRLLIASPIKSSAYNLYSQINQPQLEYFELDINDSQAVLDFVSKHKPSRIGFEIESVNTAGLKEAQKVMPSVKILQIIQDKGKQKQWYKDNDIKTAEFQFFKNTNELKAKLEEDSIKLPLVLKTRTNGYDGRGVATIRTIQDLNSIKMPGEILVEELIDIAKEISVIIVRGENGKAITYPCTEMSFDEVNQLKALVSPTISIPENINQEAQKIAQKIAEILDLEGILAVEFLYSKTGELYVNEMAPRPHNSGHHSIEAYNCSQFEQYLRVLFGLELKTIKANSEAAAIYNIVGVADFEGEAEPDTSALKNHDPKKISFHWYHKTNKNNRKLGHLTVLANSPEEALKQASILGKQIEIKQLNITAKLPQ